MLPCWMLNRGGSHCTMPLRLYQATVQSELDVQEARHAQIPADSAAAQFRRRMSDPIEASNELSNRRQFLPTSTAPSLRSPRCKFTGGCSPAAAHAAQLGKGARLRPSAGVPDEEISADAAQMSAARANKGTISGIRRRQTIRRAIMDCQTIQFFASVD